MSYSMSNQADRERDGFSHQPQFYDQWMQRGADIISNHVDHKLQTHYQQIWLRLTKIKTEDFKHCKKILHHETKCTQVPIDGHNTNLLLPLSHLWRWVCSLLLRVILVLLWLGSRDLGSLDSFSPWLRLNVGNGNGGHLWTDGSIEAWSWL